jgi:hypothetical protein
VNGYANTRTLGEKGTAMSRTTSSTETVTITSDIVRAFAEALDHGFTGSLNDFAASDAGKTAAQALADQKNAAEKTARQSAARAVARDLKVNGHLTTYSKDRAIMVRDWLATVDFDTLPEPETATADEPETATTEDAK